MRIRIVLCIVLAIVLVLAVGIAYFGIHNGRLMNRTADAGLITLQEAYTVTEMPESDYSTVSVYGVMKFRVSQYDIEGLGNLCVMKMNMGLMQMVTFVITPYEKQMPMFSVDYIYTLNKRKAIVEFYDLVPDTATQEYRGILTDLKTVLDAYPDLADYETDSAWYDPLLTSSVHKEGTASQDERFSSLFEEAVSVYTETSAELHTLSDEEQAEKLSFVQKYCDDMIENGGFSTNVFKKALGEDTTRDFFARVFFGTAR